MGAALALAGLFVLWSVSHWRNPEYFHFSIVLFRLSLHCTFCIGHNRYVSLFSCYAGSCYSWCGSNEWLVGWIQTYIELWFTIVILQQMVFFAFLSIETSTLVHLY
jgi:hypothetical protein